MPKPALTINGLVRWTVGQRPGRPRGLGRDAGHGRRRASTATRTSRAGTSATWCATCACSIADGRAERRAGGRHGVRLRHEPPAAVLARLRCRRSSRCARRADALRAVARDRWRIASARSRSTCRAPVHLPEPRPGARPRARRHPASAGALVDRAGLKGAASAARGLATARQLHRQRRRRPPRATSARSSSAASTGVVDALRRRAARRNRVPGRVRLIRRRPAWSTPHVQLLIEGGRRLPAASPSTATRTRRCRCSPHAC